MKGKLMGVNTRSDKLFREAREVMPGGVNTSLRRVFPELAFTGAQGAMITDADGNKYIDYHAAFGPILLGHNFEAVNRRVAKVMQDIDLLGVGTTEVEIELAKRSAAISPQPSKFCSVTAALRQPIRRFGWHGQ